MRRTFHASNLAEMLGRLLSLRQACMTLEARNADRLSELERIGREAERISTAGPAPGAAASTRNLLHYLAIRQEDLRELHAPLAELGLSSLGRIEAHVLANLDAVISALSGLTAGSTEKAAGIPQAGRVAGEPAITLTEARTLIETRTALLLGASGQTEATLEAPEPWTERRKATAGGPRIMVTLPGDAADDPALIRKLLEAGMTCARINTAHDGPEQWERMCVHVRREAARSGIGCRIVMDLAGPKLRTGPIEPGPEVVRVRPVRDALGREVVPAQIVFRAESAAARSAAEIPVDDAWLAGLRGGDCIELLDTRGRQRLLTVKAPRSDEGRVIAECDRTVYLGTGTRLRLLRVDADDPDAVVGRLPAVAQAIMVRPGDLLVVSLNEAIGRVGGPEQQPVLTCTLPEAFARVKVGDPVWIDDGRVGAKVEAVLPERVELRVTHAARDGDPIREDKGINLPETDLGISGLTPEDLVVLPIAARNADIVGISFVQDAADVVDVRRRLTELGGSHVGTILKIETRRAFENLPSLLLAALQSPSAGVMIARGDLAVEVGYDRLAEVQEEILWLCEAAHLPVIWATQVLETMAKKGHPSRAEVTDAAMGERAECVMLNKGPHIVEAVRFLDDLLRRMQEHQSKKRPILRALNVARRFGRAEG